MALALVACSILARTLAPEAQRLASLEARLWSGLRTLGDVLLNGEDAPRAPGILNVSFAGVEGESLIAGLAGVAVSAGAACNSEAREPSYVLRAMGRDAPLAESSLRFSFGRFTTEAEVDAAIAVVRDQVQRLRALSPARPAPALGACEGGRVISGEAGSEKDGTWVRFHLLTQRDTVKEALFQAYGCPHTVDTVAWLCAALRGRARADLVPGTPQEWAQARSVPVEKLGRLLRVEDALRACLTRWT